MNYKDKYLKYKTKYLKLKNQKGGSQTVNIYLVMNLNSSSIGSINQFFDKGDVVNANIFTIEQIAKYYNDFFIRAVNNNLNHQMNHLYGEILDSIGLFYATSNNFKEYWQGIADEVQSNINVFIGDNITFRNNIPIIGNNACSGINILISCSCKDYAKQLNQSFNSVGKKFVGFAGEVHNIGNTIYRCGVDGGGLSQINFETIFNTKLKTIAEFNPTEEDIIIILLSYIKIINEHAEADQCMILPREKIIQKFNIIKVNPTLSETDSYFKTDFLIRCNNVSPLTCNPDIIPVKNFISTINIALAEILKKKAEEEQRKKAEYDIVKKTFEELRHRIKNSDLITKENISQILQNERLVEIINDNHDSYELKYNPQKSKKSLSLIVLDFIEEDNEEDNEYNEYDEEVCVEIFISLNNKLSISPYGNDDFIEI